MLISSITSTIFFLFQQKPLVLLHHLDVLPMRLLEEVTLGFALVSTDHF